MKRPKIKDMNPSELARFRSRALGGSIIAVTKPAWVANAPLFQCGEVLHFIGYHQTPNALN